MKKVLSVRIENDLYTKVCNHDLKNSELVSKSLNQYFRQKEPNQKISDFVENENVFNQDYVNLLNKTLDEKEKHIDFLQKEVENLTILTLAKTPLLERIKMKLLAEKPK